jgi:hypothetical protein
MSRLIFFCGTRLAGPNPVRNAGFHITVVRVHASMRAVERIAPQVERDDDVCC